MARLNNPIKLFIKGTPSKKACVGLVRRADTAQLVESAAAGDQRAWDSLIETFGGLVSSVVRDYRLSDADAAEVEQATWLRLVENLVRLRDPGRIGLWLATTARRECLQHLRHASRVIPTEDVFEQVCDSETLDAAVLTEERDRALWSTVAELPDRERQLLGMLIMDPPASYAEISVTLQMPVGSIGPTRARVLRRLRREAWHHGLHAA